MPTPIDIGFLERLIILLRTSWLGPWQKRAAQFIIDNLECILQAPRQTGKTYVVALVATAYLVLGLSVTLAMPTMKQAESILFRTISQMMRVIIKLTEIKVMRGYDNKTEKVYTNGGILRIVSGEQLKDAEHPPEGYTADLLIIDEGHRSERSVLAVCLPFLTQAKRLGQARVIILGVGGHEESLIEEMKDSFAALRISPEEVTAADPTYQAVFDSFKRDLTPIDYEQHIECKAIAPGLRHIFQNPIQLAVIDDPERWAKYKDTLYFGIDVGRDSDQTVVTVIRSRMGYLDWIDTYTTMGAFTTADGEGQDVRIYAFIDGYTYDSGNIRIETNGMGAGLYDILVARHELRNIGGVHLGDTADGTGMKRMLVDQLTRDARDGIFRCSTAEQVKALQKLKFEIKPSGKREYEHSDDLSSLLMAYAAMQTVKGY